MNYNKTKSLNRLINQEPDERILSVVNEFFEIFILSLSKPISDLSLTFNEYFKSERIISFRQISPKSLNQKGDAMLQVPRLWILYIFVMHLESKVFRDILITFKEGLASVKQKEELLTGLTMLLERFPEINITTEDEIELDRILGPKSAKTKRDIIAISECRKYALVKLPLDQQKKLKNPSAIVPIKNNPWLDNCEIQVVHPFTKLLAMSNYTYHPCP